MNRFYYAKKWFIRTALSYLGTPYVWGGDDPSGFDCSGLVVECLKSAGIVGEGADFTAAGLLSRYRDYRILKPRAGALLFYLSKDGRAKHVVICLDAYYQIGAGGGGSRTTTEEAAWRDNAYVRIRPVPRISSDIRIVDPFQQMDVSGNGD